MSLELETSNFQSVTEIQILQRLWNSEEHRDLLLSLFKETEEQRDHFKGLLKDIEKDRNQLKQKLIMAEEKEKYLKIIFYNLSLVVVFWKCVTGMQ